MDLQQAIAHRTWPATCCTWNTIWQHMPDAHMNQLPRGRAVTTLGAQFRSYMFLLLSVSVCNPGAQEPEFGTGPGGAPSM